MLGQILDQTIEGRVDLADLVHFTGKYMNLFGLWFNIPVNSYGHNEMVTVGPTTLFSCASSESKQLTSTQCIYFRL